MIMNVATDFMLQVQEKAQYMNDEKKLLILQIMDNFLSRDDWNDEELSDKDLHYITLAEQEYINGETESWDTVVWK
jgi:hypothetical protein